MTDKAAKEQRHKRDFAAASFTAKGNSHLTFGHVVSLENFERPHYFIYSDGFTKTKVSFRNLDVQGIGSLYDRCLLRIYPSFITKTFEQVMDLIVAHKGRPMTLSQRKSFEKLQLEKKLITEYKNNLEIYEKLRGQSIPFGTEIQLLHVVSNKFLSCDYVEAQYERENFRLYLAEFSSPSTVFKILPCYNHQLSKDSLIRENEPLFIVSQLSYLNRFPYIHASQDITKKSRIAGRTVKVVPSYKNPQLLDFDHSTSILDVDNSFNLQQSNQYDEDVQVNKTTNIRIEEEKKMLTITNKKGGAIKQKFDQSTPSSSQVVDHQRRASNAAFNGRSNHIRKMTQRITKMLNGLSVGNKLEANVSLEQKSKLKVNVFSSAMHDDNILCFGDIIWLHNIELDCTLVMDKSEEDDLYLKLERVNLTEQQQKYEGNTNGMWIVENVDYHQGGFILSEQSFYLRHFGLGKYLTFSSNYMGGGGGGWGAQGGGAKGPFTFNLIDQPNKYCLFQLSVINDLSKGQDPANMGGLGGRKKQFVTKDSVFYIRNPYYMAYVHILDVKVKNTWEVAGDQQHQPRNEHNLIFNFQGSPTDEDTFKLYKGTTTEVLETSFLQSQQNLLSKTLVQLRQAGGAFISGESDGQQLILLNKCRQLQYCLQDLENFCNNKLICTTHDSQKKFGQANHSRQKILREQFFIDLLIDILQSLLSESELEEYSKFQLTNHQKHKMYYFNAESSGGEVGRAGSKGGSGGGKKFSPTSVKIIQLLIKFLKKEHQIELNPVAIQQYYAGKGMSNNPRQKFAQVSSQIIKVKKSKLSISVIRSKVELAKIIYRLLISICKENNENQRQLYSQISIIKYQFVFIKEAVDCVIALLQENQFLINNLSEQIRAFEKQKRYNQDCQILTHQQSKIFLGDLLLSKFEGLKRSNSQNRPMDRQITGESLVIATEQQQQQQQIPSQQSQRPSKILQHKTGSILLCPSPTQQQQQPSQQQLPQSSAAMIRSQLLQRTGSFILPSGQRYVFSNRQTMNQSQQVNVYAAPQGQIEDGSVLADDLLMHFMLETEKMKKQKNINILRFFDAAVKFQGRAVQTNQEILFEFYRGNPDFAKNLFFPLEQQKNKLKIQFRKGMVHQLDSLRIEVDDGVKPGESEIHDLNIRYLISQIHFFADLARGRNLQWNNHLKNMFTLEFIVDQIFNQKLHQQIRSAFTDLATSLYIDREPFTLLTFPDLCRTFNEQQQQVQTGMEGLSPRPRQQGNIPTSINVHHEMLKYLLDQVNQFIMQITQQITEKQEELAQKAGVANINREEGGVATAAGEELAVDIQLGPQSSTSIYNSLNYDIIKLNKMLIQFGVYKRLNLISLYSQVISNLIIILEYFPTRPLVSYALGKNRKEKKKLKKKIINKNKIMGFIDNVGKEFAGIAVNFMDAFLFLGLQRRLQQQNQQREVEGSLERIASNLNSDYFSKNPLMSGLITLQNMIAEMMKEGRVNLAGPNNNQQQLQQQLQQMEEGLDVASTVAVESLQHKIEMEVKMELCDLLIFLQSSRMDYMVSRFFNWFIQKNEKFGQTNAYDRVVEKKILEEIGCVLPKIYKTGIEEIDSSKEFQGVQDEESVIHQYDAKALPAVPGLDKFFLEADGSFSRSEILPSLITTFLLSNNSRLKGRVLEVMIKCFSQSWEFMCQLNRLEVFFDLHGAQPFSQFQGKIIELKQLVESSEIWLNDFAMGKMKPDDELQRTITLLKEIAGLFYFFKDELQQQQEGSQKKLAGVGGSLGDQNEEDQPLGYYFWKNSRVGRSKRNIDPKQQKIFAYLHGAEPIITLIKETQKQLGSLLRDVSIPHAKKNLILSLLHGAYVCLGNFCYGVEDNQIALSQHVGLIIDDLQFDYGQFDLIICIYQNNVRLCESFPEHLFRQIHSALVEFGRQERFVEVFAVIQKCFDRKSAKVHYIIDNQARVINWFLGSESGNTLISSPEKTFPNYFAEGAGGEASTTMEHYLLFGRVDHCGRQQYQNLRFKVGKKLELEDLAAAAAAAKEGNPLNQQQRDQSQSILISQFEVPETLSCFNATKQPQQAEKGDGRKGLTDLPFYYHRGIINILLLSVQGEAGYSVNSKKITGLISLRYLLELLLEDDLFLKPNSLMRYHQQTMHQIPDTIAGYADILAVDRQISNINLDECLVPIGGGEGYTEQYDFFTHPHQKQPHLSDSQGFTILKPHIVSLLIQLYLNGEKTVPDLVARERQFFIQVFKKEDKRIEREYTRNCTCQDTKYVEYFFDYFLNMTNGYIRKIISRDPNLEYKTRDDYCILLKLFKSLHSNFTFINMRLSKDRLSLLVNTVKNLDEELWKAYKDLINLTMDNITVDPKGQFVSLLNNPPEDDNAEAAAATIIAQQKQPLFQKNYTIFQGVENQWLCQENWKNYIEICLDSEAFSTLCESELSVFSQALLNVSKMIQQRDQQEIKFELTFKGFLTNLVHYFTQNSSDFLQREDGHRNMTYILRVFERIIDDQCTGQQLVEMQNLFDQCDATQMVLNLISDYSSSHPFDDAVFLGLLNFACKLLKGGNKRVQTTVYKFFLNYYKSEALFERLYSVIFDQINTTRDQQQPQFQQAVMKKLTTTLAHANSSGSGAGSVGQQDFDNYSKPWHKRLVEEAKQADGRVSKNQILLQALQLLKYFCEGHNSDLQNYLRYQQNNRTNYNLITAVVELLYDNHQEITRQNYCLILACLETLTVFVQGPCSQNQETIIDSKFLEIAAAILSINISKKALRGELIVDAGKKIKKMATMPQFHQQLNSFKRSGSRIPKIKRWQLEQLKYHMMVLLVSLLEMNSGMPVINRIMRSLPLVILKKNLIKIFKRYKKMYKNVYLMEAFGHYKKKPTSASSNSSGSINSESGTTNAVGFGHGTEAESEEGGSYYEIIIETGFLIFFIINYFLDIENSEVMDNQTSVELKKIKSDFQIQSTFKKLQTSIIGRLYDFIFALIFGILGEMQSMQQQIRKVLLNLLLSNDDALADDEEKKQEIKELKESELFSESLSFFSKNSAHIEVVHNNQIEKVHFIIIPYMQYLPKEKKSDFNNKVNRNSLQTKLLGLIQESHRIIRLCKHEFQLGLFFQKYKFISIFANFVDLWRDIAFIITILLNIFILISYQQLHEFNWVQKHGGKQTYIKVEQEQHHLALVDYLSPDLTYYIFSMCGIIMVICSTFVVVFYLCKKAPIYVSEAWEKNIDFLNLKTGMFFRMIRYLMVMMNILLRVLMNVDVVYYLAFGCLAFLAVYVHPFFFAFHLTEIFIRYSTLRYVVRSILEPRLILVYLLLVLIIFIFTVFSFAFIPYTFNNRCESMLFCLFEFFDQTFKNQGSIGQWLISNDDQDPNDYAFNRFFFDNFFYILQNIIMINLISGIIIDKFNQLRIRMLQQNLDVRETCFICGISRETFDRKSEGGFQFHIKTDHYMWNYVHYIAYLQEKGWSELTGIESFVRQKIITNDYSWFPIQRSRVLAEDKKKDQKQMKDTGELKDFSHNVLQCIHKLLTQLNVIISLKGSKEALKTCQLQHSRFRKLHRPGTRNDPYNYFIIFLITLFVIKHATLFTFC